MRLFGHPMHPMLVHLPIALWVLASACDGLTLLGVHAAWPLGWWCLVVGVAAALPAMAAGMADFGSLPESVVPLATRHMTLMGLAWAACLGALILRSDGLAASAQPSLPAMATALVGVLLMAVGAWHGGQMVYGLGVGAHRPRDD